MFTKFLFIQRYIGQALCNRIIQMNKLRLSLNHMKNEDRPATRWSEVGFTLKFSLNLCIMNCVFPKYILFLLKIYLFQGRPQRQRQRGLLLPSLHPTLQSGRSWIRSKPGAPLSLPHGTGWAFLCHLLRHTGRELEQNRNACGNARGGDVTRNALSCVYALMEKLK